MRTEHIKRNIDIDQAVRNISFVDCFFVSVRFLLSIFCSALSIKRISIKKEMPRNEAPPLGFVVCLSPLKIGILFQKILLLACGRLQDKAQTIGF